MTSIKINLAMYVRMKGQPERCEGHDGLCQQFSFQIHSCDFRDVVKLSIPWALVLGRKLNAVGGMVCEKQTLLFAHAEG